jgi:adenylate cyclase
MTTQEVKRKLTAILNADVKGYSRLMGEDEVGTIRTLNVYKEVMTNLIHQYHGRVIDAPGDNVLAEFGSVVDAVECAVEVQRELKTRNAELSENRRMEFRIGVNLGDVIEDGEQILGDGVNIAARLESLSEGGGVCISRTVYENVENKLPLKYEYLGEQNVKNIARPVQVYRVLMETEAVAQRGLEVAPQEKMAFPLPDKPSIAVLPFVNMSDDPKQEYFSDGMTEEIITALSKVPRLFVIARNSTFAYKGKAVMVQQVARELGVRYVLEGSVRRIEDRVRVTAQLIDAMTGNHLWAEKYDRNLKDVFAVQDELTFKVVAALQVKLTEGDQALIVAGGTINFEAYSRFLKGLEYFKRFNKEGNLLARKMGEEIIALDPNYPRGYRMIASTHWLDVSLGVSKSPKESLAKAAQLFQRVIEMDPSDAVAHSFLGWVYTMMRQHEKGMAEAEKAVTVNPNAADAHSILGGVLHYNGNPKEAIEAIKKAIRLNPFPPAWYWHNLGMAYCQAGIHEEAIVAHRKALGFNPDNLLVHVSLAATYSLHGRKEEARAEAEEVLRINPRYSVEYFQSTTPYKNPADMELMVNALLKAGLPKTPPGPK